jgi:hypothetical protein
LASVVFTWDAVVDHFHGYWSENSVFAATLECLLASFLCAIVSSEVVLTSICVVGDEKSFVTVSELKLMIKDPL